jgi:hypothetical protein
LVIGSWASAGGSEATNKQTIASFLNRIDELACADWPTPRPFSAAKSASLADNGRFGRQAKRSALGNTTESQPRLLLPSSVHRN